MQAGKNNFVVIGKKDKQREERGHMESKKRLALASDHGGFELKEKVKDFLKMRNLEVIDLGTNSEDSVDYPEFGKKCGKFVADGNADLGIVICGTGIGISIAANKVDGIRCALCTSKEMAEMSKKHNNANVLALGGRTTSFEQAKEIISTWLENDFEGGRHQRRIDQL